ncbi:MAG: Bug family tripartite tricarboxylate transporter substrate binding protein [Burkholderiales bacterium]
MLHLFRCVTAVALAVVISMSVMAQSYPSKPIRAILVEGAPGAVTDLVTRAAAPDLAARLGQPIIIENRAGGNGLPGMEACIKSAPDGHTMCMISITTMSFHPHTFLKLHYDPERDTKPVTQMYFLTEGIYVPAALPVNSMKELQALAIAREKSGALNFGIPGVGSNPDIYRQWLAQRWKTNIVGVPYKGFAPIVTAVLTGEVDFAKMGLGNAIAHIKSGKIKILAVTSAARVKLVPEAPTMEEAGVEGFNIKGWWGVVLPAGAPDAIAARLSAEFVRQFREPKFADFMESSYLETVASTPEQFGAFLKTDREYIGQLVRQYNVPKQ